MGVNKDSEWDKICQKLSGNAVFNAVEDPVVRKTVFNEILTEQAKAASIQNAQIHAESEFKVLLKGKVLDLYLTQNPVFSELTGPAICATSTWPRVKKQIFEDPRYQSVPENKRRALFDEYRTIVKEIENEEQEATRIAELKALKERASRETSAAETRLAELVNERQRLKQEYKKMQSSLEAMESKLSSQRKALALKKQAIQKSSDGSLLFKFNSEDER